MSIASIQFESFSPEDTKRAAIALATMLRVGDALLLKGPVGAGKSLFARALILSLLDVPEDIPSPTFTLVQVYETKAGSLWHCDLYRLSDPNEVIELGLDEALDTAICLIEWPDRLGDLTPKTALMIDIKDMGDDHRRITFSGDATRWKEPLSGLEIFDAG